MNKDTPAELPGIEDLLRERQAVGAVTMVGNVNITARSDKSAAQQNPGDAEQTAPTDRQGQESQPTRLLSPCFCFSKSLGLSVQPHLDHGDYGCSVRGYYIVCSNCWARGPAGSTKEHAADYWNNHHGTESYDALRQQIAELEAALRGTALRQFKSGPCWCGIPCPEMGAHEEFCSAARKVFTLDEQELKL